MTRPYMEQLRTLPQFQARAQKRALECPYFRSHAPRAYCGKLDVQEGAPIHISLEDCDHCLSQGPSTEEASRWRSSMLESYQSRDDKALRGAAPCSSCTGVRALHRELGDRVFGQLISIAATKELLLSPDGLYRAGKVIPTRSREDILHALSLDDGDIHLLREKAAAPFTFFDRVVVISLKRRHERLHSFMGMLEAGGWEFKRPEVFTAVEGDLLPHPQGWNSGGGAYGCLRSHQQVLEGAIMDGVESILVLEDDAVLCKDFQKRTREFLLEVPHDWECLMLGGQHMYPPFPPPVPRHPGIVRCINCQRTHGYAVRGSFMRELYRHWVSWKEGTGHADHLMGPFAGKRITYAPEKFLLGQGAGKSDIQGDLKEVRFWNLPDRGGSHGS